MTFTSIRLLRNISNGPIHPLLWTGLGLIMTMNTVTAQTKDVVPTVPMIAHKAISLDGKIDPTEWKSALVLQAINRDVTVGTQTPQTQFRIIHDGTALWVAVDCEEPRPKGPVAQTRGPQDNLSIDDAVEVAIGLSGAAERKLTMGGYEGASDGVVPPMQQLYEFVVNAVGSKSRRFDEAPLPNPNFEAKVSRRKTGWSVELRIPFASVGIKDPLGLEIYANFVRFRFPDNMAWRNMHKWGGYKAFPAARVRLAAKVDETNQLLTDVKANSASSAAEAESLLLPTPSLEYFPLSRTVIGQVKLPAGGSASLRSGEQVKHEVSKAGGLAQLKLVLPQPLTNGTILNAAVEVKDAQGMVVHSQKKEFVGGQIPEWSGTDAGTKYLKDAAPAPWQAPQVNGNGVHLTHANITFGQTALPSSIRVADGDILASAFDIRLSKAGKPQTVKWVTPTVAKNGIRPVIYSRGRFGANTIEVRTEVDYDGFMAVQVRLEGQANAIDRIQFVCPLKTKYAHFIAQGSVQSILNAGSGGYRGQGRPRFWLGSETGGIAVAADLPFYQARDRQNEIAVKPNGEVSELVLTPIDSADKLKPGSVLQFYLQPTPVRTPSKTTTDDYNLWFEQWSDYQGFPDLAKMEQVKEHSKASHAEGKQQILYFNQLLAENAPGFAEHRKEFVAPPERMWYQRSYDPGKGVKSYVCCARGPYGDLLLDGIRKLANEGNIDGIYMDGTSVDWDCENPSHRACNVHRAPVWGQPGPTRIIGTRDFLKRARGIFAAKGKPFTFVSHTGGDLDIHTLGLVDFFVEGEQLSRYLPQYRIPRHEYAVGYSGAPWGYRTMFHDYWRAGRGKNWTLVYALLFNSDTYGAGAPGDSRPLMRDFDGKDAKFHPYWKDGQKLLGKSKNGQTSVSYYTSGKGAMVVATNFSFSPDEIELKIADLPKGKDVNWVDLLTKDQFQAKNGVIRLTLPPYHGVALRPQSEVPVSPVKSPTSAPIIPELEGPNLDKWVVNVDGGGVRREEVPATATSPAKFILHSVAGGAEARAFLDGSLLGGDVEAHLKLRQETGAVVRLEFGPVMLTCAGGNWTLDAPIDDWNDQRLNQIAWPIKQENDLELIIRDRKLYILANGQPVANGMLLRKEAFAPRPLKVITWAGESVTIQLVKLTAKSIRKMDTSVEHPVNP